MPRININEYAYIDYKIEPDGSINITEKHNIPNGVIYYDDGVIYLKNGMQWKEILKFDEKERMSVSNTKQTNNKNIL